MEQLFHGHFYVLISDLKELSFYFKKTFKSFLKLFRNLLVLILLIIRGLGHLLLVGPVLYKKQSPGYSTKVERNYTNRFPMF
jgi:hypothetical protein